MTFAVTLVRAKEIFRKAVTVPLNRLCRAEHRIVMPRVVRVRFIVSVVTFKCLELRVLRVTWKLSFLLFSC